MFLRLSTIKGAEAIFWSIRKMAPHVLPLLEHNHITAGLTAYLLVLLTAVKSDKKWSGYFPTTIIITSVLANKVKFISIKHIGCLDLLSAEGCTKRKTQHRTWCHIFSIVLKLKRFIDSICRFIESLIICCRYPDAISVEITDESFWCKQSCWHFQSFVFK